MTITKITKAKAVSAVRQAVKTKGRDHTAQCVYESHGQPGCIVGHALFNLGVDIAVLETMDRYSQTIDADSNVDILQEHDVVMTPKALEFFRVAQGVQDNGQTWGEAVDKALNPEEE